MPPDAGDDPPLKQLAIAYGVRKKGWDQLSGVSAAIMRELPATVWDELPEDLTRRRITARLAKSQAVSQVVGIMVVNVDSEDFRLFKQGLSLYDSVRNMMDSMVEAVAFKKGGASKFVDIVLDNMRGQLASGD